MRTKTKSFRCLRFYTLRGYTAQDSPSGAPFSSGSGEEALLGLLNGANRPGEIV